MDIMVYVRITARVISILFLLLFLVLKTSRRKIGELPVFDFLAVIILGSVVGADIADPDIEHLPTAYAVVLIVGVQYIISHFIINNRKIGGMLTFGPTVVIQKGQFVKSNMKRLKYTIDDVMMHLREKDVFDINEVEFAIVEDSGNISVLKKSQKLPITLSDMSIPSPYKGISIPLIVDGMVIDKNLKKLNLGYEWLELQLKTNGIKQVNDIFYMEMNTEGKLFISRVVEIGNVTQEYKII